MIRRLRRRHRTTIYMLVVILPLVAAAGISLRKPVSVSDESGLRTTALPEEYPDEIWARDDLWRDLPSIRTRLMSGERLIGKRYAVELSIPESVTRPDVLLYWSPREIGEGDEPGSRDRLLGAFKTMAPVLYPIPGGLVDDEGFLVLYSLAHEQAVASAQMPARNGGSP